MRFRTRHLACLLLVLTALGAAGAAATPTQSCQTYLQALFARGAELSAATSTLVTPASRNPGDPIATALPSAPRNLFRTTPAVHPPVAQAAAVHTATSFART